MDKLLGRLSRCYRPLGSFPQTTSSPPISNRRISIFITPVGQPPLMQDRISILVMVWSFKETASRLSLPVSRFRQPRLQAVAQIRAVCLIIDNLPLFNASDHPVVQRPWTIEPRMSRHIFSVDSDPLCNLSS
jgi:hypothetical protein